MSMTLCIYIIAIVDRMTDVEVKDAGGCQIHSLIDVDGYRMWRPLFRTAEEQAEHVRSVVNVPLRDDDIMFCSAPKSGIGIALSYTYIWTKAYINEPWYEISKMWHFEMCRLQWASAALF